MKNRILLFTLDNLEFIGGVQRFLIKFYENLKKKGHYVEIVDSRVIGEKSPKFWKEIEKFKRTTLIKLGKREIFGPFTITLNVFKLVSKINKFKIIYVVNPSIFDLLILFIYSILGKKVIFGFHNKTLFSFEDIKNKYPFITHLMFEIYTIPYKFLFKFIKIHALNYADKKLLQNVLKVKNVIVIPNFITLPKIKFKIKSTKKFNVLFVGRLDKYQKGLDLLAKIIEEINKRTDKINFWIVGDGKDRNIVEEIAKKYKNVKYFGKVSDEKLIEIYKNSSLLIITSRFECFPLVSLEAQYFGIPVIAFNIDVFKERKYIFKIKPFNIKSFSNKILEIYKLWKENKEKYLELRRKIKEHSKIYTFDYIYEKYWKNILES